MVFNSDTRVHDLRVNYQKLTRECHVYVKRPEITCYDPARNLVRYATSQPVSVLIKMLSFISRRATRAFSTHVRKLESIRLKTYQLIQSLLVHIWVCLRLGRKKRKRRPSTYERSSCPAKQPSRSSRLT